VPLESPPSVPGNSRGAAEEQSQPAQVREPLPPPPRPHKKAGAAARYRSPGMKLTWDINDPKLPQVPDGERGGLRETPARCNAGPGGWGAGGGGGKLPFEQSFDLWLVYFSCAFLSITVWILMGCSSP